MRRRTATPLNQKEWADELAAWGMTDEPDERQDDTIPVWPENWNVIEWWLTIPGFLKWNNQVCIGMDVLAVKADAELSGREMMPEDYSKLKLIARTLTEELNSREQ